MKNLLFLSLLVLLAGLPLIAQQADTTRLYFGIDRHELTTAHRQQLDSLQRVLSANNGYRLQLIGYTDFLGSAEYNLALSERRVEAVKAYLGQGRIRSVSIVSAEGKGRLEAGTLGHKSTGVPQHRRVDVVIEKTIAPGQAPPISATDLPPVSEIEEGQTIVLKQLNFYGGRHIIKPEAKPELERLLELMRSNPKLEIEIQGHICCEPTGDGLDNDTGIRNLSVTRAKYVYDYLTGNGIEPARLSYKGYARTRPLVRRERTEEDRERNRRVEIKILKK